MRHRRKREETKVKQNNLPKWMTKEDVAKFLRHIDLHVQDTLDTKYDPIKYRAIFELAYRYGLRQGEAVMLDREDIDLEEKTIYIKREKGSTSKFYPLPDELIPMLQAWIRRRTINLVDSVESALFLTPPPNCRRLGGPAIALTFRKIIAEAGLGKKSYRFHSLRHSIAVHSLKAGLGLESIRDLLGHVSYQSTLIYAQIESELRNDYFDVLSRSEKIARL